MQQHPSCRCPVTVTQTRGITGIVQAAVGINTWLRDLPSAEAIRPRSCPRCGVASRRPGRTLSIHGHGVVKRDLWGPLAVGAKPAFSEVLVRRYRCLACRTVLRVCPRGVLTGHLYHAGAIGLALALWSIFGQDDAQVRSSVSPWREVAIETKSRWPSLIRWARAARDLRLWPVLRRAPEQLGHRAAAAQIIRALMASAPQTQPVLRPEDAFIAAQDGGGAA